MNIKFILGYSEIKLIIVFQHPRCILGWCRMIVVDRIEEDTAVIEIDGKVYNLPKKIMPEEINEGDVISINIKVLKPETKKRKNDIKDMFDELLDD